jgi:hypothetical protein
MSKIRIYELAKQLGVANKDLVAKINSIGIEAKSHMAMLTEEEAAKVTALYQPKKEEPKKDAPKKEHDHAMDEMRYFAMDLSGGEKGGFAAVSVARGRYR